MNKRIKRVLFIIILLLSLLCIGYIVKKLVTTYNICYKNNVPESAFLYVPTGATLATVIDSLQAGGLLLDGETFLAASREPQHQTLKVCPGRYHLEQGMNNTEILRMLKFGWQEPVKLVVAGAIRTKGKLAAALSRYVEPDSATLARLLSDESLLQSFGYTSATVPGMIVPNTYEVYWNISAEELLQRLHAENVKFWNGVRMRRLAVIGLTRDEAITLASVVNEETNKTDEMPRVAGVYMNRLKKRIALQADPTLKYAWNDFALRRVLNRHKSIDSPYNTYKYPGLPPGPICVPSIAAIDAVLYYEQHDYLYFCADAGFTGYHVFAQTLAQHNKNAAKYRQALNLRKIYR
ncbi:MAG: endolytic transglycosylase MltG [Prevotellaceae bacterium]|jgi:UPF0755 protein|nr:endolytic transglycosylase MltG [Prevotellaceae bacterium]